MKKIVLFFYFIFVCCYATITAQCDNVAIGKPVTASGVYLSNVPANAINGSCGDGWNSGGFAQQYIEIDLGSTYTINNINIMFDMAPNGNVNHEILTSPDMVAWTVVDVATGFYVTGQLIERCYSSAPLTNVRGVRINSISSPSWIAIREMGIYTLSAPATPTITASGSLELCQGESVTLTSSIANSYLWSTGETTQSIVVNSAAVYSVATNQAPACTQGTNTCTTCGVGTASKTVSVNPLPTVSVSPPAPSTCIGSALNLIASGADTYSWSPSTGLSASTGDAVSANPAATSTYTVTGTDILGCINTAVVTLTVNPKPTVDVRGPMNPLCDSTKLNWASWGTVTGTSGAGTISSDLSVLVTKPSGGLSTTGGMYNGGVFPPQYNVPANNTAIRNDLAGLFTFCFNRPVVNPQIAMSSIGNGGNSVQINTSVPYQVIWSGIGMSYPTNTSFIGAEGFTIIQFPGLHTCISFDYLQSETYCNLAFGTLDTNCQSLVSPPQCGGGADTLTASGAVTYSWSPTTGLNTSAGAVVIASPLVTTTYYVTGFDANNCSDTDSITVTVVPLPVVTVTGDTLICLGDSTTLTATGGGTYLWSPGNSTDSIITVSPSSTTIYTVVVTNSNGCIDSSEINVVVNPLPQALFAMDSVCLNTAMSYNESSTGNIINWNWNYGDGTVSTVQNGPHTYAQCGIYLVKLAVTTSMGCKDSISKMATVNCLPVADFSSTDVCLSQTINFIDLSVVPDDTINSSMPDDSVTGWAWNFGDGSALSTIQNASRTYISAGPHNVSLIVTSHNGCKDTAIKGVNVHPRPMAKFSTTNVCDGTIVPFTDQSTVLAPDLIQSWEWNFGDGSPVFNNQTTSHPYSSIGTYSAKLVVVSNFGCADSITKGVTVSPNPVVSFYAPDTSGCAPLCISFIDQSSITQPSTIMLYEWNVGDGSAVSYSQTFDHCFPNLSVSSAEYYSIILTVTSDSGCFATMTKNSYISVFPNPVADFYTQPTKTSFLTPLVEITNASAGADFWNWNFGDQTISSVSNPGAHTYADTGTYLVTLITSTQFGCSDTANKTVVIEPDFVFYIPNAFSPNNDIHNKTFSGKGLYIKEYEMTIFDRWGNFIYKTTDINLPWDGKLKNSTELAEGDVYVYSIKIIDIKKDEHFYKGIVTLLR
ncbi:MAG: PKD domain-containing protein [Bacteroidota bacterium]